MVHIVKISAQGRFTIPKVIRDKYGWKAGQRFSMWVKNGGIILKPINSSNTV